MSKTAWEPAPIKEGVCGSCKHLNKNILSRLSYPQKYPCMKSARKHTEFDECDVFLDQEEIQAQVICFESLRRTQEEDQAAPDKRE